MAQCLSSYLHSNDALQDIDRTTAQARHQASEQMVQRSVASSTHEACSAVVWHLLTLCVPYFSQEWLITEGR